MIVDARQATNVPAKIPASMMTNRVKADPENICEFVAQSVVVAVKLRDTCTSELERIINQSHGKPAARCEVGDCKRLVGLDRICDLCSRPDYACIVCDPEANKRYGKCRSCCKIFCGHHNALYLAGCCSSCDENSFDDSDE